MGGVWHIWSDACRVSVGKPEGKPSRGWEDKYKNWY